MEYKLNWIFEAINICSGLQVVNLNQFAHFSFQNVRQSFPLKIYYAYNLMGFFFFISLHLYVRMSGRVIRGKFCWREKKIFLWLSVLDRILKSKHLVCVCVFKLQQSHHSTAAIYFQHSHWINYFNVQINGSSNIKKNSNVQQLQ